ncbi:MAG: leucine-rich repeat domain-containing protein [Defluviitaleaceae bacterium]|nr:leucine-rich repeat domain-containing protein [Defluviitaleaceae bacterium]
MMRKEIKSKSVPSIGNIPIIVDKHGKPLNSIATTHETNIKIVRQKEKKAIWIERCIKLAIYGGFVVFAIYAIVSAAIDPYAYRGDFRYRVIANGTEIAIRQVQLDYKRTLRNELYIPSRIRDLPVTTIGTGAFSRGGGTTRQGVQRWRQLIYVYIPYGVTDIGINAFSQNLLVELTIPNSVTHIRRGAFADNLLIELTIPDSVTYIGDRAFANNQLTYVSIPSHASVHRRAFDSEVTVMRRK